MATQGVTRAYTADEVDFIVAYIVPENLWYVIPISFAALRNRIYISPNSPLHSGNRKIPARPGARWLAPATPPLQPASLLKRQQDYPFERL